MWRDEGVNGLQAHKGRFLFDVCFCLELGDAKAIIDFQTVVSQTQVQTCSHEGAMEDLSVEERHKRQKNDHRAVAQHVLETHSLP